METLRKVRDAAQSDSMKRTVRELKNKVYAYTEMEQLVREATCNDANEPNGMLMQEIARGTFTREFSSIMSIVWRRVKDKSSEHHPYKCLVLIEYLMLRGVNDSEADARRLLSLLEDCEAKVNLIEFNPHAGTIFEASPPERVRGFRSVLIDGGLVCTIRSSRGDDEMAACGQLGNDLGARGERALAARKRRGIAV